MEEYEIRNIYIGELEYDEEIICVGCQDPEAKGREMGLQFNQKVYMVLWFILSVIVGICMIPDLGWKLSIIAFVSLDIPLPILILPVMKYEGRSYCLTNKRVMVNGRFGMDKWSYDDMFHLKYYCSDRGIGYVTFYYKRRKKARDGIFGIRDPELVYETLLKYDIPPKRTGREII